MQKALQPLCYVWGPEIIEAGLAILEYTLGWDPLAHACSSSSPAYRLRHVMQRAQVPFCISPSQVLCHQLAHQSMLLHRVQGIQWHS